MAQITLNSTGVASSGALTLQSNGTTTAITVDASQNVGIGAASPAAKLNVSSTGNGYRALFDDTTNDNTLGIYSDSTDIRLISLNNARTSYKRLGFQSNVIVFSASNGSESARIDSSGNLLVNNTAAGDGKVRISANGNAFNILKLDDTGSTGGNYIQFLNSAGNQAGAINHNGTITVNYGSGSDYRLKDNVQPMVGALDQISRLKPVTYNWIADNSAGQGFIAHELQAIIPDAVVGEKDALNEDGSIKSQMVDTSFLVATLTSAIQEQQALIQSLTTRITALEGA